MRLDFVFIGHYNRSRRVRVGQDMETNEITQRNVDPSGLASGAAPYGWFPTPWTGSFPGWPIFGFSPCHMVLDTIQVF